MSERTPEEVCRILNEAKWRGRRKWMQYQAHPVDFIFGLGGGAQLPIYYEIEDARAIASYIELTKPGSFLWALEQMKAGKAVKRSSAESEAAIVIDRVKMQRGELDVYYLIWRDGPQLAAISSSSYEATDWQIVEEHERD